MHNLFLSLSTILFTILSTILLQISYYSQHCFLGFQLEWSVSDICRLCSFSWIGCWRISSANNCMVWNRYSASASPIKTVGFSIRFYWFRHRVSSHFSFRICCRCTLTSESSWWNSLFLTGLSYRCSIRNFRHLSSSEYSFRISSLLDKSMLFL